MDDQKPTPQNGKNHMLVASGICDVLDDLGEVSKTVDVFLYKQLKPFSERSPELFGFLSIQLEEDKPSYCCGSETRGQ